MEFDPTVFNECTTIKSPFNCLVILGASVHYTRFAVNGACQS